MTTMTHDDNSHNGVTITEDDVIVQAMVVYLLYRLEYGYGNVESYQKLVSIWDDGDTGETREEDEAQEQEDTAVAALPRPNLWHHEIQSWIATKKLGPKTLRHGDSYDNIPKLYGCSTGRRRRRQPSSLSATTTTTAGSSTTRPRPRTPNVITQVHILAEQALIQSALYVHQNVSQQYAILASTIIQYALIKYPEDPDDTTTTTTTTNNNDDENNNAHAEDPEQERILPYLAQSLLCSSRKENRHGPFPIVAYEDILQAGHDYEREQEQEPPENKATAATTIPNKNDIHHNNTNNNNHHNNTTRNKRHRTIL